MMIVYIILTVVLYLAIGFVIAVLATKYIGDDNTLLCITDGGSFAVVVFLWWFYLFMTFVNFLGEFFIFIVKIGSKLDRLVDKIREDD